MPPPKRELIRELNKRPEVKLGIEQVGPKESKADTPVPDTRDAIADWFHEQGTA